MIKFLEAETVQAEQEIEAGIPNEFLRIDITNKTNKELQQIIEFIKTFYKNARLYIHKCYHDEDPRKPCERKEL